MPVDAALAWSLLLLVLGVVALWAGAEALVRGAAGVAYGLGLRAATVGVTVVAFATTAPELFVATIGAVTVSTDVGLGAIVGSNVANIGLVLGVAALIRPLEVSETVLRRHVPFMVLAALLPVVLAIDGVLGRIAGVIFLLVLAGFSVYVAHYVSADPTPVREADDQPGIEARTVGFVIVGLVALLVGSRWLVDGGVGVMGRLGFPDLVIGLTVLGIGTSLPELAASGIGALREEASFAIGNVVGSNIYNLLAVLGILAVVVPISVDPAVLRFELPALVVFTVVLTAMLLHERRLSRLDGAVLLGGYVVFLGVLIW